MFNTNELVVEIQLNIVVVLQLPLLSRLLPVMVNVE
jgi:hypothetical protein